MGLPLRDDYRELFLSGVPLLDVRAPVEFAQGAFPGAVNLPLLDDEQRRQVGVRYKEQGQQSAIELGHELVSGPVKEQRLARWAAFVNAHPEGALYCFRGGLRSRISQEWIHHHTGVRYPRIKGGYKAMRRFLLAELERIMGVIQPVVLSGRTGTGKTLLLQRLCQQVDLEGIFRHRGSAFGRRVQAQPSQIDIENSLAIVLLRHQAAGRRKLVFEDESGNIGSRRVPDAVLRALAGAPLVVLRRDFEARVTVVFEEYIEQALAEYQQLLGAERGFRVWSDNLLGALERIQRRLGGLRYRQILGAMTLALEEHRQHGERAGHRQWIAALLRDYYDPMYDYQLSKKAGRVVFEGEPEAVLAFLHSQGLS